MDYRKLFQKNLPPKKQVEPNTPAAGNMTLKELAAEMGVAERPPVVAPGLHEASVAVDVSNLKLVKLRKEIAKYDGVLSDFGVETTYNPSSEMNEFVRQMQAANNRLAALPGSTAIHDCVDVKCPFTAQQQHDYPWMAKAWMDAVQTYAKGWEWSHNTYQSWRTEDDGVKVRCGDIIGLLAWANGFWEQIPTDDFDYMAALTEWYPGSDTKFWVNVEYGFGFGKNFGSGWEVGNELRKYFKGER